VIAHAEPSPMKLPDAHLERKKTTAGDCSPAVVFCY